MVRRDAEPHVVDGHPLVVDITVVKASIQVRPEPIFVLTVATTDIVVQWIIPLSRVSAGHLKIKVNEVHVSQFTKLRDKRDTFSSIEDVEVAAFITLDAVSFTGRSVAAGQASANVIAHESVT